MDNAGCHLSAPNYGRRNLIAECNECKLCRLVETERDQGSLAQGGGGFYLPGEIRGPFVRARAPQSAHVKFRIPFISG